MPCFLVPLHEFNQCHNPEGQGGGQFCSTGNLQAHVVPPGTALLGLAQVGQAGRMFSRRFIFNPATGAMAVGVASGTEGREQSHAEMHTLARKGTVSLEQLPHDYDRFTVHGHLLADPLGTPQSAEGPLAIRFDRITTDDDVARIDALHAFLAYAVAHGATKTTPVWSPDYPGLLRHHRGGTPLGKIAPDLFPKTRRRKKAA